MQAIAAPSSKLSEKLEIYLDSRLDRAFFLPPGFEIIPRLLLLLDDPEADGEKLAELIRIDPGLTADLLRVANCASLSGRSRIETAREAIFRVGLREVCRIVMKIIASPVFLMMRRDAFARLDLWKHSFAAAVGAQVLAEKLEVDPEVAFTTGLLHDIGKIAIAQVYAGEYMAAVDEAAFQNRELSKLEEQRFQTNHAIVGGQLLERWNFPERIAAAVGAHHNPFAAPRPYARLAAITYLANAFAYRLGRGFGFPEYVVNPDGAVLRMLDLSAHSLGQLEQEVTEEYRREEAWFR